MSRERAERRAARERRRAAALEAEGRRVAARRRRRERRERMTARMPRPVRYRRARGLLARRRRLENGVVAAAFLVSQVVVWLLSDAWAVRLAALVVGILALPVLVTLVLDRRS